jgi:hypothetical protein
VDEKANTVDGQLIDLSGFSLDDLLRLDESVFSNALRRIMSDVDQADDVIARFNNRI